MAMGFGNRNIGLVNDTSYKPTYAQTGAAAFQQPFLQIKQIADYVFPSLLTEDSRSKTTSDIANINEALSDPRQGLGQHSLNNICEFAGIFILSLPLLLIFTAIFSKLFPNICKKIKSLVSLKYGKIKQIFNPKNKESTYITTKKIVPNIDYHEEKFKIKKYNKIPWYLICGTLIVISSAFNGSNNREGWCLAIGCIVMLMELLILFKNQEK